jgi:PadR family transcriptional regulator, regulatory protein PadR
VPRKPNESPHARAILAELTSDPQGWRYGYELLKRTGIKSGTLYPLLMRLHDQGFLEAEWRPAEVAGRPQRHAYRLTAKGLALARMQAADRRPRTSLDPSPVPA